LIVIAACAAEHPTDIAYPSRSEFSCVRVIFVDSGADPPAVGFLGVVAALAGPEPVNRRGIAAFGPGLGMVAAAQLQGSSIPSVGLNSAAILRAALAGGPGSINAEMATPSPA
jgi:hypothetical protein